MNTLLLLAALTFNVIGIDCIECVKPVTKVLKSVKGVTNVQLDWKAGRATVDVPQDFDRTRIRTALMNAGYDAVFAGETRKDIERLPGNVIATLDITSYPGTVKVDIDRILVKGKVTIVDFYGDWCGPCHLLETRIQHLMNADPSIALRRINIGKWDNAGAKQATALHAEALPYIRVYDRRGKFVMAVTGGMWDEVTAAIEKAKTH
jgi:copper chaperone CopZ